MILVYFIPELNLTCPDFNKPYPLIALSFDWRILTLVPHQFILWQEGERILYTDQVVVTNLGKSKAVPYTTAHRVKAEAMAHSLARNRHRTTHQETGERCLFLPGEDIGSFIEQVRRRSRIKINEIAAQFPTFLPWWNRYTYGHLVGERKRLPQFQELLPLYQSLVIAGVQFSASERNRFVLLARQKIEGHPTSDSILPGNRWASLLADCATFDGLPLDENLVFNEQTELNMQPFHPSLLPPEEDHRHLVGREEWIQEMLDLLHRTLPKKVIVIQAVMGAGKSSALHLLKRTLQERGDAQVVFFQCATASVGITPEEHLERLTATILNHLGIEPYPLHEEEDSPAFSLTKRIEFCMSHLAQMRRPTILLVDNGEGMLDEQGQVSSCWYSFFTSFLRFKHQASLVLATRTWPTWKGRNRVYLEENRLPPLAPDDGVSIWRHLGFSEAPESLLRLASIRCHGNPWLIELRASTLRAMPEALEPPPPQNDPAIRQTFLIERLLEEPHLFSSEHESDIEALSMLKDVLDVGYLSPDASALLELLACAGLPLAPSLLNQEVVQSELACSELSSASLLDSDTRLFGGRIQLLPLVIEAMFHRLETSGRRIEVEQRVMKIYHAWLKQGIESDQEKSSVIAEVLSQELRHGALLDAAERLIRTSWLLARYGHVGRIARMADEIMKNVPWSNTPEQECGCLLLHYHLAPYLGQPSQRRERAQAYEHIYSLLLEGHVHLHISTEFYLLNHLVRWYTQSLQFQEAERLLSSIDARYPGLEQASPHRSASLMQKRASLFGAWSEYTCEQGDLDRTRELRQEAIALFRYCISIWQRSEQQTRPSKRSTYKYWQARCWNDLAYYLRQQGEYAEALASVEQSLVLKLAGYVEPGSLATSYSEKAQCLAAIGQYQAAMRYADLAVMTIEQDAATSGNQLISEDVWIYDVERGRICARIGKREEAKCMVERALRHPSDDRHPYQVQAHELLNEIQAWEKASPSGQLDWRWQHIYRDIVRYDPFHWLTHAGPFTEEEQAEWTQLRKLPQESETEEQLDRLAAILTLSRDRELAAAFATRREPRLLYPLIPIDEVAVKKSALTLLQIKIRSEEPNLIVRRLYDEVIDEHLAYLNMIQAVYEGNTNAFQHMNRFIHSEPSPDEMRIVLASIGQLIQASRQRSETAEVGEALLRQLRSSGVPAETLEVPPSGEIWRRSYNSQTRDNVKPHVVSPHAAQRFFDAVMQQYGFDGWRTVLDPTVTTPRIEQLTQCVIMPNKTLSVESIRALLAHEIETHVFRAAAGVQSPLDLLATGTRNFMATEEGLALYYERETDRVMGEVGETLDAGCLFGTLATGLASGVISSPHSFLEVYDVLEPLLWLYRTMRGLGKNSESSWKKAKELARARCLRTFRGVPDLNVRGVAYLKDALYLRGDRLVSSILQADTGVLERLMVGVVGVEQLADLAELGIVKPPYPPRWLAHDPDLASYVLSFEMESERG